MVKFAATLISVGVIFFATPASAQGDDKASSALLPGKYSFRLLTPSQAEDRNKDVTKPANVSVEKTSITIDTQDGVGKPMTLQGISTKSEVKFGLTSIERTSIISLHFVGVPNSDVSAEGTFAVFVDGKKMADGKWALVRTPADSNLK